MIPRLMRGGPVSLTERRLPRVARPLAPRATACDAPWLPPRAGRSVDSGLSVLEWRNYDLVGTFLAAGLGTRLQE